MSMTRRGKAAVGAVTALLGAGLALGYFSLNPAQAPAVVRSTLTSIGLIEPGPPPTPTCPLTGLPAPHGRVPDRPVLAIKVENYPDARPQAGLNAADLVYEELVEGGITRFVALYQCHDAPRVGPVRSARTADPDILAAFGRPILAYSGGAPNVVRVVNAADLIPIDETRGGDAFTRDPSRPAPHNLYAATKALYRVARSRDGAPDPVFTYAEDLELRSRRVSRVHLPFSSTYADVWWTWSRRDHAWLRSHGDVPHRDEDGEPVSATNVVVQVVDTVIGPRGGITPHLELTGSGRAYVFRDGRMILGRWERPSLREPARFLTRDGAEIPLAPGRTWVELLPSFVRLQTER
jgi:hypothetical protein